VKINNSFAFYAPKMLVIFEQSIISSGITRTGNDKDNANFR